jgi:hypothetical protein
VINGGKKKKHYLLGRERTRAGDGVGVATGKERVGARPCVLSLPGFAALD